MCSGHNINQMHVCLANTISTHTYGSSAYNEVEVGLITSAVDVVFQGPKRDVHLLHYH